MSPATGNDAGSSPEESPPRYAGIRTFARQPHVREQVEAALEGVDVAVVGAPFDTGASYRPGARFGPEAIRSASVLLRPFHPVHGIDVLGDLEIADWGDLITSPGDAEKGIGEIADGLRPVAESDSLSLVLGGDHSVALGELRALAARHGPLALVLLDSHPDTWDSYRGQRYFHGTPFRRAVEEGLLDPARSIMAGMRGPIYAASDIEDARELGFELIPWEELRRIPAPDYGERVRKRVGAGPAFFSFDIDFVDPAFAPATGTPEPGGPSSAEALDFVRSLTGIPFSGFDVVEVSPVYDGPGQATSLLAANVAYEMLALVALGQSA